MYNNKKFSSKPEDFFKNIDKLPYELVDIIESYIPRSVTAFLNKTNYLKQHSLLTNIIKNNGQMENYIRAMVRQDNDFVFNQLLKENYKRWIKVSKYYYKECIYLNYLIFLESYTIENESTKCRKIIGELLKELGLSKNQHKKNTIQYIRWRT
jgi:hypothetical protein